MKAALQGARRLGKAVLEAERLTHSGRINALGMVLAFVIVIAVGIIDVMQAIVRAFRPGYTTGLPGVFTFFVAFLVFVLLCVVIVMRLDPEARRSGARRRTRR